MLSKSDRFLSLSYLEEPGIECCLWPHLYWKTDMCETVLRKNQAAKFTTKDRKEAENKKGTPTDSDTDDEDKSSDDENNTASYIKHSFMIKVLSPVIGYSADYELLQFVYDLHMWTTLGVKKNMGQQNGVSFRLMLKTCSFSPENWRT